MRYIVLQKEDKEQIILRKIGQLEAQHFALEMNIVAWEGNGGEAEELINEARSRQINIELDIESLQRQREALNEVEINEV